MHKKTAVRITTGPGWTAAPIGNTRKRHAYDRDGRSLCGRYALFAYRGGYTPLEPAPLDNGDLCVGCAASAAVALKVAKEAPRA